MATNHIKCVYPVNTNKFYISTKKGGLSEYAIRDTRTGYTLPNCTAYAEVKFNEEYCRLTGIEDKIVYSFTGNAQNFYSYAQKIGLEVGSTPREGAIMCWSATDKKGHVAICDEVISASKVKLAESSYSGKVYNCETVSNSNKRWGMSGAYTFLGFIYNPSVKDISIPSPVAKDTSKNQVRVVKATLRVRTYPTTNGDVIGLAKTGYYNYTDTANANGYIWYKIGDFQWVAGVSGTLEVYCVPQIGDKGTIDNVDWEITKIDGNTYSLKSDIGTATISSDYFNID